MREKIAQWDVFSHVLSLAIESLFPVRCSGMGATGTDQTKLATAGAFSERLGKLRPLK